MEYMRMGTFRGIRWMVRTIESSWCDNIRTEDGRIRHGYWTMYLEVDPAIETDTLEAAAMDEVTYHENHFPCISGPETNVVGWDTAHGYNQPMTETQIIAWAYDTIDNLLRKD